MSSPRLSFIAFSLALGSIAGILLAQGGGTTSDISGTYSGKVKIENLRYDTGDKDIDKELITLRITVRPGVGENVRVDLLDEDGDSVVWFEGFHGSGHFHVWRQEDGRITMLTGYVKKGKLSGYLFSGSDDGWGQIKLRRLKRRR